MNAQEHKRTMQAAFAELAIGNGRPFGEAMSDDIVWRIAGASAWSKSWHGKAAVRAELLRPLYAQFAEPYRNRASRFVAEDDIVVVECQGSVATRSGPRYDNSYCYVCRFGADGKIVELIEYMDTALAERVLSGPG